MAAIDEQPFAGGAWGGRGNGFGHVRQAGNYRTAAFGKPKIARPPPAPSISSKANWPFLNSLATAQRRSRPASRAQTILKSK
jgi:hypothetical protein